MNSRTTILGIIETVIGVCAVAQVLTPEQWQDPKVWANALLLAAAKTLKEFYTADAKTQDAPKPQ